MKTGIPNSREIERKFLLKRLPEKLNRSRRYIIAQGYLATEPAGRHVRLRKKGKTASLTFKVGRGAHREEREIKLSPKQFAALWPATAGRRLRKLRHEIPWKDLLIEIDMDRCVREIVRLVSDLRDAQVRLQTLIQLRDEKAKGSGENHFPHIEELLSLERESFSAAFAGWQRQAIPRLERVGGRLSKWPLASITWKQICG